MTITCMSNNGDVALLSVSGRPNDTIAVRRVRTHVTDTNEFRRVFRVGSDVTAMFQCIGDGFRLRRPDDEQRVAEAERRAREVNENK